MAVTLVVPYQKRFNVEQSQEFVAAFFSAPLESIKPNFPGLREMRETSPNHFDWRFEKISHSGYDLEIAFSTKFDSSANATRIIPTSSGATLLEGTVALHGTASQCDIDMQMKITLNLPIPGLLKGMVSGFAERELTKLFDRFTQNVQNALKK